MNSSSISAARPHAGPPLLEVVQLQCTVGADPGLRFVAAGYGSAANRCALEQVLVQKRRQQVRSGRESVTWEGFFAPCAFRDRFGDVLACPPDTTRLCSALQGSV